MSLYLKVLRISIIFIFTLPAISVRPYPPLTCLSPQSKITEESVLAFNPLLGLKDPAIEEVFFDLIRIRHDLRLLTDFYKLGALPQTITFRGKAISLENYIEKILDFLRKHLDKDPLDLIDLFKQELQPNGDSTHIQEILALEDAYNEIVERVFGLELIKRAFLPNGRVADVGAGRNRLGIEILQHSDNNGWQIEQVVGTDIIDWGNKKPKDSRLRYLHQPSSSTIPIESGTIDTVIVKWSLHHMSPEDQRKQIQNIARIVRTGGRIIVVENLMTNSSYFLEELEREQRNGITWLEGPWKDRAAELSKRYMGLNVEQQRAVLALEDYYSHMLLNGRKWMPMPFTYLTIEEIQKLFSDVGLKELPKFRRVLGAAPFIHRGPPAVVMVFEKKETVLIRGPVNVALKASL